VPKFAPDRFPPGFFDLPADAGEGLPLAVIERWTDSAQTQDAAREILAPHTLRGIVVSSDAAGLTRLSRERPLVEILALINRPKEIIHAYGRALGGRAIGTWAADNTQMFYPAELAAERVVGMLRAVQDRLDWEHTIGIGLAAHRGVFYELGDGVFGPDADRVETVAEEHTEGGELVITGELADALPAAHGFVLAPRDDLAAEFGRMLRVSEGPALTDLVPEDFRYPTPFDEAFYAELRAYSETPESVEPPHPEYRERAIVLVERERDVPDIPEMALLNDLALTAAMARIGRGLVREHGGEVVKTAGHIGLYAFREPGPAADFAQAFRAAFAAQGVQTRIGIDVGQVLVFELGRGRRDIAGAPVNVASKLAQDCGEFGRIYLSDVATARARLERQSRTVTFDVSGISLTARTM
jgi:class 3 adenylate cyclase